MPPGISAEASASLSRTSPQAARAHLRELAEVSLLDEDEQGHFTSHVLVKAYAHELFLANESDLERAEAVVRLLAHYAHSGYHAGIALMPRTPLSAPPPPPAGVIPERPTGYDEAMRWFDEHGGVASRRGPVAMQSGGIRSMRQAVYETGDRLTGVTEFYPRPQG